MAPLRRNDRGFSVQEVGARPVATDGRARFRVWAPRAQGVSVEFPGQSGRLEALRAEGASGWHSAELEKAPPGTLYYLVLRYENGEELRRPDPASRRQPEGVHGPSEIVDLTYDWRDADFRAGHLRDLVIYELHIGAFTPAGTFVAAAEQLPELAELGVNAVELLPVAAFPGERNWGYDGVLPYAVQASYGTPQELQRFIDAAHSLGIAVFLDVVYNHLGPEGNYLRDFGPYFTDAYHTPWGEALNYDGPDSDETRAYFLENACYWLREFRFDGLRLDAVHAIRDHSPYRFTAELNDCVRALQRETRRRYCIIAESDQNDARLIRPRELGGDGLDGVWNDDYHHALHTLLTGERRGYYQDYGDVRQLARALGDGFIYAGDVSRFRRRRHGSPAAELAPVADASFIVCSQNHDQVGNRMRGERLSALVDLESQKLAACATLLAPFTPLLWMGEEYGETAPFQYFISHGDARLIEAVRRGRAEEFRDFHAEAGEVPDPADPRTFERSKLNRSLKSHEPHAALHRLYARLLEIRRGLLGNPRFARSRVRCSISEAGPLLCADYLDESRPVASTGPWTRGSGGMNMEVQTEGEALRRSDLRICWNFAETELSIPPYPRTDAESRGWRLVFHSGAELWSSGELQLMQDAPESLGPRQACIAVAIEE